MDQRDLHHGTTTIERPRPPAPHGTPHPQSAEDARRGQGVRDLVGGAVLIGIGFLFGGSVFMGNPTTIDWIFDGLGTFWVAKGIYFIATAKPTSSV